jgi:hypothetical protein
LLQNWLFIQTTFFAAKASLTFGPFDWGLAWRAVWHLFSAGQIELENVEALSRGAWLDQHSGSRSTQIQHLGPSGWRGLLSIIPPPRPGRRGWFENPSIHRSEEAEIVANLTVTD